MKRLSMLVSYARYRWRLLGFFSLGGVGGVGLGLDASFCGNTGGDCGAVVSGYAISEELFHGFVAENLFDVEDIAP
jgi:hypothetical protein